MSIELMLQRGQPGWFVAFTRVITSCRSGLCFCDDRFGAEVAVGLALIVTIFRTKHSISIDE